MSQVARSRIDGRKQSGVAEWLEQALHGALCEQVRTNSLVFIGRNENDRNPNLTKRQFLL